MSRTHSTETCTEENSSLSDKFRFMLLRADGRSRINQRHNERHAAKCILEHDRFCGGSVMVWAGIHRDSHTALIRFNGVLTVHIYWDETLQHHVVTLINVTGCMFQHNKARSHTARVGEVSDSKTTFMSYHGQQDWQVYPPNNTSGTSWIGKSIKGTFRHKH